MRRIGVAAVLLLPLGAVMAWVTAATAEEGQHLPPIECPLRKAGIDPTKLKPFDEVEKYIHFLERADRAKWQKPDEVVDALGLEGSESVVDLGAGSGYFTFRLAKALPRGKVLAIDTQPEMVRHVHRKVITEDWPNVRAQVGKTDDPGLPRDADLVFVCDVLMHVPKKSEWLGTIRREMHNGARLVLIDFREGDLPEGPPEAVKVPKAEILRLCKEAGFQLIEDKSRMLPYQEFLVFQAAAPSCLSLDKASVGALPQGWTVSKTGRGPGSQWAVVEDAAAPGGKALAQTSDKGPSPLFNLCTADGTDFKDLDLTVSFKAVAGKIDQGGGPVWRYRDANNYYVARMNPLEDNYRVYKVVDGKRTQLGSADVRIPAGEWHGIRIVHQGDRIQCYLDGTRYLNVTDDTFKEAGKVGLWTKADAQTSFVGFRVTSAGGT